MNRIRRKELRQAWAQWIGSQKAALFVTLNFNRDTPIAACRTKVKAWCARLDRRWLGRNWCREKSRHRTNGIGVLEHLDSNLHIHFLIQLPAAAADWRLNEVRDIIEEHWIALIPSGTCDVQKIYSVEEVADYVAKELDRPGRYEEFIILSEFHRDQSGK
jgi:hypothetical protein